MIQLNLLSLHANLEHSSIVKINSFSCHGDDQLFVSVMEPAQQRFEKIWKDSFPDESIPSLSCLKQEGISETEKQTYRDALKVSLDYHAMRIEDLQKKQAKEQFILEFIADELDKLPVPRQGSFSSESSSPNLNDREVNEKPKPKPRIPPAVPKKPNPSPRDQPNITNTGAIKRSMSTPHSAQTQSYSGRRAHFNSVIVTPATPEREPSILEKQSEEVAIKQTPSTLQRAKEFDRTTSDDRFSSFKGSSFKSQNSVNNHESVSSAGSVSEYAAEDGSEASSRPVSEISQGSDAHVRRKVGRDSMKRMQQLNIEDTTSDDEDEDDSNYQHLWDLSETKPSANRSQVSYS